MKKTIALAIITIFILSIVPYTLADEGRDDNETDDKDSNAATQSGNSGPNVRVESRNSIKIRDLREDIKDKREDIRDTLNIDRQRCLEKCRNESSQNCEIKCKIADRKEDVKDLREDIKDRMNKGKNIKILRVKNAEDMNIRHLPPEKIEMLRNRFEEAKVKFEDAKDELENARKEMKEAVKKRDTNATIAHAKDYLLHTSDALISHLEKLKAKVQENENIPDDREATIVAQIDAEITKINSIKAEIEAATTREEIKDAAKKLRDEWNTLKHIVKLFTYRIVAARVEGIVNQGLVLEKRLDNILKKLNESGVQDDLTEQIDEFKAKISESRDKYKQAQAKLTEAIDLRAAGEPADSDKIKTLLEEANDLLKQSRDALKDAHDLLKDIVKKVKQADSDADLSSETEVEVEYEVEIENETDDDSVETNATAQAST